MNKEPEKSELHDTSDISSEKIYKRNIRCKSKYIPSFDDIINEGLEHRKLANDINNNLLEFLSNYSKAKMIMQHKNNKNAKNVRNYPQNLNNLNINIIPKIQRNSFSTQDDKSIQQKNISKVDDLNIDIRSKSPSPYQGPYNYSNSTVNSNSATNPNSNPNPNPFNNSIQRKMNDIKQNKMQTKNYFILEKDEVPKESSKLKNPIDSNNVINLYCKPNEIKVKQNQDLKDLKDLQDLNNPKLETIIRTKDALMNLRSRFSNNMEDQKEKTDINLNLKKNQENTNESIKSGKIGTSKSLVFPKASIKYLYERRIVQFQALELMNKRRFSISENPTPVTSSSILNSNLNSNLNLNSNPNSTTNSISDPIHNEYSISDDFIMKKNNHFYIQNLKNINKQNQVHNELTNKKMSAIEEYNLPNSSIQSNFQKVTNLLDSRFHRKDLKPSTIIHQFEERKEKLSVIRSPFNVSEELNYSIRFPSNFSNLNIDKINQNDKNQTKNLNLNSNLNNYKEHYPPGELITHINSNQFKKESTNSIINSNISQAYNLLDKKSNSVDESQITNFKKIVTSVRKKNSINNKINNIGQPFLTKTSNINQSLIKESINVEEGTKGNLKINSRMKPEKISQLISHQIDNENPTMITKADEINPETGQINVKRKVVKIQNLSSLNPLNKEIMKETPIYYKQNFKENENENNIINNKDKDNQIKLQNKANFNPRIQASNNRNSDIIPSESTKSFPDQIIQINFCFVFLKFSEDNQNWHSNCFSIFTNHPSILNRYEKKKIHKNYIHSIAFFENKQFKIKKFINTLIFENKNFQLKFDKFKKEVLKSFDHIFCFYFLNYFLLINALQFIQILIIILILMEKI